MTTTIPQGQPPEIAPQLAAVEPLYAELMQALCAASRRDEDMPTLEAATTLVELTAELIVRSGLLWQVPGLVAALRKLADDLEARRNDEPLPARETLREFFAAARPPH